MYETIKQLAEAWGPSGYEHHVRAMIRAMVADFVDDMREDALGNLICRVGEGGPKVMLAAHMDEIGLMANYVEPKSGYMRFERIGGVRANGLNAARVQFEDGTIGVVGMNGGINFGTETLPTLDNFYIDVSGAEVEPGSPAMLVGPVSQRGDFVFGRAMDDRIGCAVLVEMLRKLNKTTPNEVYAVFTVQEEVGLRGARTAAYSIEPDVGIAIDVTATGDEPYGIKMAVKLGEGVAIKFTDRSLVVPPKIRDWMVGTAEANGIPYQREVLPFGGTDAGAIHMSQAGVPSGVVSIPCRHVHSVSETVSMTDVQASIDLLLALVKETVTF